MKTSKTTYKRISIIWIITSIIGIVVYQEYTHFPLIPIENTSILTSRQQQVIGVQYALRDNNIPQAIYSMPTQTAKDFYNRATLKTIRAYELMEEEDITYKKVLEEAQQDFNTAASKTTNIYLQQKIKNNLSISNSMQYIGQIKTCFIDLSTLWENLENINDSIDQTIASIQNQLQYINENKDILNNTVGSECVQNIENTFNTSYSALTQTAKAIQQQIHNYTQITQQHIDNPEMCLQTNIKPIIQDAQFAQDKVEESQQTYAITQMALQNQNLWILQQMCEQAQDDTLSNQDLDQSLSQLLENLESDTQKQKTSQQETTDSWTGEQDNQNPWPTTAQPQYIPLTQEEKILLEQANQNNQERINTMMHIKKNDYNPSSTLQTIFEIFYGDTNEFNIPGR